MTTVDLEGDLQPPGPCPPGSAAKCRRKAAGALTMCRAPSRGGNR